MHPRRRYGPNATILYNAPTSQLTRYLLPCTPPPQDDSADPVLEYANRAALELLQLPSFDDAVGRAAVSLVDEQDPTAQQDWIWACADAAEREER